MVLSEHRGEEIAVVFDRKRASPENDSPRVGDGQRIAIDALCRSPLSPRGHANISRPGPRDVATSISHMTGSATMHENAAGSVWHTESGFSKEDTRCSSLRYFSVHLVVAAVAEGDILSDNDTRKTKCVLDQLTRNVSKEQNQVVVLPVENSCIPLKLRVFVKASLEAKALNDYFTRNHDQMPAPFIMLSRGLHMAVAYDKDVLDPSDAGVADRFRKQAKTRAVKLIKEALENPVLGISSALLRGHLGACSPARVIDPFLYARCVRIPFDPEQPSNTDSEDCKCFIFEAKHKKNCSPQILAQTEPSSLERPASPLDLSQVPLDITSGGLKQKRTFEDGVQGLQGASYFPVTLYITAVGDGVLAKDVPEKARERLESILTKIPKEQQTSIECGGGLVSLKLRVFVANSEDAKAVGDYIKDHSSQMPAAVVLLCREVLISLRCEAGLDMKDSSVADRLRKQAKTRAVKLVRDLIVHAKDLTLPILRGQQGPVAPALILEPLLSNYFSGKGEGFWTDSHGKKFVMFSAKNKFNASPMILPQSPRASSPSTPDGPFALDHSDSTSLSNKFLDRKKGVTIDVNRERTSSLDGNESLKLYTPSSLEGALLLDSCRILASNGQKDDKTMQWGRTPSADLARQRSDKGGIVTGDDNGRPLRSLVDGCWQGLGDGGAAPGSPLQRCKRVRLNPA